MRPTIASPSSAATLALVLRRASAGSWDNLARLGWRHLQVVASDEVLCFCIGLLRPRIVVSTGLVELLDQAELEAVLAHEASHQRRRDPMRLMVAERRDPRPLLRPGAPGSSEGRADDHGGRGRRGSGGPIRELESCFAPLRTVLEAVSRTPVGVSPVGASDLMRSESKRSVATPPLHHRAPALRREHRRPSRSFSLWASPCRARPRRHRWCPFIESSPPAS